MLLPSVTVVALTALLAFAAQAYAGISGTVVSAAKGEQLPGIQVCAMIEGEYFGEFGGIGEQEELKRAGCTTTTSTGAYSLGLGEGHYWVRFEAAPGVNYVRQFYDGKPGGAYLYGEAGKTPPVSVTGAGVVADATMYPGGEVTGKVTSEATHTGIAGIEVCALNGNLETFEGETPCTNTNAGGEYSIIQLDTQTYTISFYAPSETESAYKSQVVKDVHVTEGQVTDISTALTPTVAKSGSGGGSGSGPSGGGSGSATSPSSVSKAEGSISLVSSKLAVVRGKAAVKLECKASTACAGTLILSATIKTAKNHHHKHQKLSIGTASFSLGAGQVGAYAIKLSAAGASTLREARGKLEAVLQIARSEPLPAASQLVSVRLEEARKAHKAHKSHR